MPKLLIPSRLNNLSTFTLMILLGRAAACCIGERTRITCRPRNEENTIEPRSPFPKKWPDWAKVFSLIGICLILFFFVDIPAQRSYSNQVLLDNEQWELPTTGIYWNVSLQAGDSLLITLRVFGNFDVIFYICDEIGNRWLENTTTGFVQSWIAPINGDYSINVDNPYIQKNPRGTISVTHYLTMPKYRVEYSYRWLQWGLLVVGIVLVTISFSEHPKFTRMKQ